MIYEFYCDKCNINKEINKPMKDGPGIVICDNCDTKMNQVFGANFILQGDGWPGKDMKKRSYESEKNKEMIDHTHAEMNREQRVVDEVMEVRRKGRKATEQLKKENPQKWNDYLGAMKKGVRASKKKK